MIWAVDPSIRRIVRAARGAARRAYAPYSEFREGAALPDAGGVIEAVVVFTDTDVPTPPCGLCREAFTQQAGGARLYLTFPGGAAGLSRPADWLAGKIKG